MGREQALRAEDEKPKVYPRRHALEVTPEPSFVRRVPARPGRFPVGFDDERLSSPPHDLVRGIPVSFAAYIGRVEEVHDGEVTTRVWRWPSAREGLTTLYTGKAYFDREPVEGDLLRIWRWTELREEHGESFEEKRIHVEVEHRELSDAERAALGALLEEWEEGER